MTMSTMARSNGCNGLMIMMLLPVVILISKVLMEWVTEKLVHAKNLNIF